MWQWTPCRSGSDNTEGEAGRVCVYHTRQLSSGCTNTQASTLGWHSFMHVSKHTFLGICIQHPNTENMLICINILHTATYVHTKSVFAEWERWMDLQKREKETYFIKSLFWNFKKLDKTNFDLRELPNSGPNENFSNVGSLIMKNGWRPLIVYRLS